MSTTESTQSPGARSIKRQGTVVSDKQDKTITIQIDRMVKHTLYKKYVKRRAKVAAHDESNEAREGDIVEIAFCRPLSKNKRWRFIRVVRPGPASIAAMAEANVDAADAAAGGAS